MTREEFLSLIRSEDPTSLCEKYLVAPEVAAFASAEQYAAFQQRVSESIPDVQQVHLAGSGNWGYSLNPEKAFRPFCETSDIDVVIISEPRFRETWEALRTYHRRSWYALDFQERQRLRRNGENIYAGFVSPAWIPERTSELRFQFIRLLNRLSDQSVSFRRVTAMYFRNIDEAVDYYRRGFSIARSMVQA